LRGGGKPLSGCGHNDHEDDWFDDLLIYDELYGKGSREKKKKKHFFFGTETVKKQKKVRNVKSRQKKGNEVKGREEKGRTGGLKSTGRRGSGCLGGVLLLFTMICALLSLLVR